MFALNMMDVTSKYGLTLLTLGLAIFPFTASLVYTNLALYKKVYASSRYNSLGIDYLPAMATDGIINDDANMARTLDNNQPGWLVVDLGLRLYVENVVLYLGLNCCWNEMNYFEIWLSNNFDPAVNTSITKSTKCKIYGSFILSNQKQISVSCEAPNFFQFVILHQNDHQTGLGVQELMVYGYENYINYYLGCYLHFDESIAMETVTDIYQCFNICKQRGYRYLTIKKKVCHCSNVLPPVHQLSFLCLYSCLAVEELLSCPQANKFHVFQVDQCPITNATHNSIGECVTHCMYNAPLNTRGKCDTCSFGWKGSICHERECFRNNGNCGDHQCFAFSSRNLDISECVCNEGYYMQTFNQDCEDMNECTTNTHICSLNTTICINTLGSYYCLCKEGFEPTSSMFYCQEIKEYSQSVPHEYHTNAQEGVGLKIATIVLAVVLGLTILLLIILSVVFILKLKSVKRQQTDCNNLNNCDAATPATINDDQHRYERPNLNHRQYSNVSAAPTAPIGPNIPFGSNTPFGPNIPFGSNIESEDGYERFINGAYAPNNHDPLYVEFNDDQRPSHFANACRPPSIYPK